MTVARLEDEMPNAEFMAWSAYLAIQGQRQERANRKSGRGA